MDGNFIIAFFVLILSLVAHEFAHGWAAYRLGDDTALRMGRLSFNPVVHLDPFGSVLVPLMGLLMGGMVFGWAKPVPVNPYNFRSPMRDHAFVAAAGPLSNLLLALVFAVIVGVLSGVLSRHPELMVQSGGVRFLWTLCSWGVTLNVLLALFNLIPIPPLDGSWIAMTFLRGEAARMYEQIRPFGFLIIVLLMMTVLRGPFHWAMKQVSGGYLEIAALVSGLFG